MSTQPPISGNPTFPPVTGPNNTLDTNIDLDDPGVPPDTLGSDAISPASQLDLPGTSTRSPIKPKTISLFRPHGVRTPRPHAAKPYSRPVPKLSKCPRFCFYDPLLMNYPELSHFVPTRLAGVRVSVQSATPRASKPGSTLPTPTEASGPVTSTAYEEYIDIALIHVWDGWHRIQHWWAAEHCGKSRPYALHSWQEPMVSSPKEPAATSFYWALYCKSSLLVFSMIYASLNLVHDRWYWFSMQTHYKSLGKALFWNVTISPTCSKQWYSPCVLKRLTKSSKNGRYQKPLSLQVRSWDIQYSFMLPWLSCRFEISRGVHL